MTTIHEAAHAKFENIIRAGSANAQAVFDRIATEVPNDQIVRGRAMNFRFQSPAPQLSAVGALNVDQRELLDADDPRAAGLDGADDATRIMNMVADPRPVRPLGTDVAAAAGADFQEPAEPTPPKSLVMQIADDTQKVHSHALGQLADRFRLHGVKIPVRYIRALVDSGDAHSQKIAEDILNASAQHPNLRDSRFLARSIGDQLRAVMSDSFKRIDCRPILDTLGAFLKDRGMVPIGGFASDTRVQLRFAIPEIFDLADGESPILIGGSWGNSDFGHGSNGLAMFAMRMWCTNGCCSENRMRQVHHGSRLPDDVNLMADTLAADTKANQLVMRDTLESILSRDKVAEMIASLRNAHVTKTTWDEYAPRLKKILGKGEFETAKKAFESEDVINLPAGQTQWRMSNAISWIANSATPNRAIALQRVAGSIAHGERTLATDDAVIAA